MSHTKHGAKVVKILRFATALYEKVLILCDFSRKEFLKAINRIVFCDFAIENHYPNMGKGQTKIKNGYPEAGNAQRKIKMAVPMRETLNEK